MPFGVERVPSSPGVGAPPTAPSDPALNAALGMDDLDTLNARVAESKARAAKFGEQVDADTADVRSEIERRGRLKPPPQMEIPAAPQPQNRSPEESFGSLAMMMAMVGSLMTRRPFVNALNSGAEVMKAFQTGDDAAAKSAFDTWKANVENAKTLHQFQQDAYDDDLKGIDTDLKGSMALLAAHAKAFGDVTTATLAENGMYKEVYEHIDRTKKMADSFAAATAKLELDRWKVLHPAGSTPTISPDTAVRLARMVIAGNHAAITELGYGPSGTANRSLVEDVITQLAADPNNPISAEQLNAAMVLLKGRISQAQTEGRRAGQLDMASEAARGMAQQVLEASAAVPRTEFMPINKLLTTAEENLGSAEVASFQAAINTFINGYARAISPTGVATVSDKDHARAMLSMAQSQEQVEGVLEMLGRELDVEQVAIDRSLAKLSREISDPNKLASAVRKDIQGSDEMRRLNEYKASLKSDPPRTLEEAQQRADKYLSQPASAASGASTSNASPAGGGRGLGSGPNDPAPFPTDGNWQPNKFYRAKQKDGTLVQGYYNPNTQSLEENPF